MRNITKDKLIEVLDKHLKWLRCEEGGERADLRYADLRSANLSSADLRYADLSSANLSYADLRSANLHSADLSYADLSSADLRSADLRSADLRSANLSYADLRSANLRSADLSYADLSSADLRYANLRSANLSSADLRSADLSSANLSYADLRSADLSSANLRYANLSSVKNVPFIPIFCPDTGAFIAWKKVNGYIIKLQIPEDAKRCSATTTKCRCDKALVLAIEKFDGTVAGVDSVVNHNYVATTYKVGEMVYPDSFDDDRWNECSHGIHFFINRQEAVNW